MVDQMEFFGMELNILLYYVKLTPVCFN
uniref:Uncharacterized protein n=1 Tax=Rhizophora mucronata TaxID=61149 RepID=A0A2P2PQ46_RHIMU